MTDIKKVYEDISSANLEYRSAVARNAGISVAKDRVKNLLFNYRETIIQALQNDSLLQRDLELLKEQRTMLEDELESMDTENNELRKKVKQLENELDDLNDQMNHSIHELEVRIEQQEEDRPARRKKVKTMTAVVE